MYILTSIEGRRVNLAFQLVWPQGTVAILGFCSAMGLTVPISSPWRKFWRLQHEWTVSAEPFAVTKHKLRLAQFISISGQLRFIANTIPDGLYEPKTAYSHGPTDISQIPRRNPDPHSIESLPAAGRREEIASSVAYHLETQIPRTPFHRTYPGHLAIIH